MNKRLTLCCNVLNNIKYNPYKIPYIQNKSVFFLWIDLEQLIEILTIYQTQIKLSSNNSNCDINDPDCEWRIEKQWTKMMILTLNIDLTPGRLFGTKRAVFYRIIFSSTTDDDTEDALDHICHFNYDLLAEFANGNGIDLIKLVPYPENGDDSDEEKKFVLSNSSIPKSCKITITTN